MNDGSASMLPMFPLGTVLFPGQQLPLQVFEPRYQVMMTEVLAGDGRFGVVLIERGSEVGGGDLRTDIGCAASIETAKQLPDGRIALVARGEERIRVARWLADDPYPAAMVEKFNVDAPDDDDTALRSRVVARVQRLAALVNPGVEVTFPDVVGREFADRISAAVGFGPFDAQRLLAASTVVEQLEQLEVLLGDAIALIELQRRSQ